MLVSTAEKLGIIAYISTEKARLVVDFVNAHCVPHSCNKSVLNASQVTLSNCKDSEETDLAEV